MSKLFSFIDKLRNHKYLVTLVLFVLFVGFVDSNSLWERHYCWERIDDLQSEINRLQSEYESDTKELKELRKDPRKVEKYAREHYYMTRPDEDLFIIQDEDEVDDNNRYVSDNDTTNAPEV